VNAFLRPYRPVKRERGKISQDSGNSDAEVKGLYRVFQKELYSGIPNVTVWRVLRKRLHLEPWIICTPLSVNVLHSPHSNIWNTIAKLFLKHPALPVEVTLNRNYLR
jgi:hypothetical protein